MPSANKIAPPCPPARGRAVRRFLTVVCAWLGLAACGPSSEPVEIRTSSAPTAEPQLSEILTRSSDGLTETPISPPDGKETGGMQLDLQHRYQSARAVQIGVSGRLETRCINELKGFHAPKPGNAAYE